MNFALLSSGMWLSLGATFALICLIVVTIALTLLFFVFKYMGHYFSKEKEKAELTPKVVVSSEKKAGVVTNDELAAIAIALYKYSEIMHEREETVLTINRVSRAYSPWSSKIYGLRQFPIKK